MPKKSIFCIATSRTQAEIIVSQLQAENFSNQDLSALFPDRAATRDFTHELSPKSPDGTRGAAGIGGALGWIAGVGALSVPGAGPLIAAGPLVAAMNRVGAGAMVGGVAGGLVGLGLSELDAKRYEGRIKQGNILLSVQADRSEPIARAREIFANAGAQDICTPREAAEPKLDRPMPKFRDPASVRHTSDI